MRDLLTKMQADFEAFYRDAEAQSVRGNKAAGARARKVSLILEKALKEFRKKSLEAAK